MLPRLPMMPMAPVFASVVPPRVAADLCSRLRARAKDGLVTAEDLAAVAIDVGVPVSHAYVALGSEPMLQLRCTRAVQIATCTGACQAKGSIALLERLLALAAERTAAGQPGIDVIPRGCLNMCEQSPALLSRSDDGVHAHPGVRLEDLGHLVATLADPHS